MSKKDEEEFLNMCLDVLDRKREVEEWIKKLIKMEKEKLPQLDHKDCGILADILRELSSTINDLTLVVDLYVDGYGFDEHHKKKHRQLSKEASRLIGKPTSIEELKEFVKKYD